MLAAPRIAAGPIRRGDLLVDIVRVSVTSLIGGHSTPAPARRIHSRNKECQITFRVRRADRRSRTPKGAERLPDKPHGLFGS